MPETAFCRVYSCVHSEQVLTIKYLEAAKDGLVSMPTKQNLSF